MAMNLQDGKARLVLIYASYFHPFHIDYIKLFFFTAAFRLFLK